MVKHYSKMDLSLEIIFDLNMKTPEQWEGLVSQIKKLQVKRQNFNAFFVSSYIYQKLTPYVSFLMSQTEPLKNRWLNIILTCLDCMSITGFYIGKSKFAKLAINKLLLYGGKNRFKRTINNMLFYKTKIMVVNKYPISLADPSIQNGYYLVFNPSIIKVSNNPSHCYLINLRRQVYNNKTRKYQGYNYLVSTDSKLKNVEVAEILDDYPRKRKPSKYLGMEDIRFVQPRDSYDKFETIKQFITGKWFSCTTADSNDKPCPYDNCPSQEVGLGQFGEFIDKKPFNQVKIKKFISLCVSENSSTPEKNWLFCQDQTDTKDQLSIFYSVCPSKILIVDTNISDKSPTIKCSEKVVHKYPWDGFFIKNSAGPIKLINPSEPKDSLLYKDNWLFVSHEKYEHSRGRWVYYHRFLITNSKFKVLKISPCFVFEDIGIEYCISITESINKDNYMLGVGIKDRSAWIYEVSSKEIYRLISDGKGILEL